MTGSNKWKRWWKSLVVLLLASVIGGALLTSWLEPAELTVLMPVRNLVVLGQLQAFSSSEIGETAYKNGTAGVNPVQVAQMVRNSALAILENGVTGSNLTASDKTKLVEVADFLASYGESKSSGDVRFKLWPYKFDYPYYGLKAPWYSAMAQGHVIEVMLATYRLTGDSKYLEEARSAANALYVPVNQGGVSNVLGDGLWFEEYASLTTKAPYVLNGHNYTLNSLWFLSKADPRYRDLFDKGVAAERTALSRYDVTVWTRYDLAGTIADGHYQRVHIAQLGDLYNRTGDQYFLQMQHRLEWQLFLPGGIFYRLVRVHNTFLLLVFTCNVAFCFGASLFLSVPWVRRRSTSAEQGGS